MNLKETNALHPINPFRTSNSSFLIAALNHFPLFPSLTLPVSPPIALTPFFLSISNLIMYGQYASYYIISSACFLYIQSMLLVHVVTVYCLHNGCWLLDKYILIVYALHVDWIGRDCWFHRQCLLIDRPFLLLISVSQAYSNIYEP